MAKQVDYMVDTVQDAPGKLILVLGSDEVAQLITKTLSERMHHMVVMLDDGLDEEMFADDANDIPAEYATSPSPLSPLLKPRRDTVFGPGPGTGLGMDRKPSLPVTRRVSVVDIPKHAAPFVRSVNCLPTRLSAITRALGSDAVDEVSHVIMAWTQRERISDSLYLTMQFRRRYPAVKLYVRIFDEQLDDVFRRFNATTFSTSQTAFAVLNQEVCVVPQARRPALPCPGRAVSPPSPAAGLPAGCERLKRARAAPGAVGLCDVHQGPGRLPPRHPRRCVSGMRHAANTPGALGLTMPFATPMRHTVASRSHSSLRPPRPAAASPPPNPPPPPPRAPAPARPLSPADHMHTLDRVEEVNDECVRHSDTF
jgi:hypothetical protein